MHTYRHKYEKALVFTYGVREQQQLEVLDGGDGAVSNQLHQGCRQRLPLKHKSVDTFTSRPEKHDASLWTPSQHGDGRRHVSCWTFFFPPQKRP